MRLIRSDNHPVDAEGPTEWSFVGHSLTPDGLYKIIDDWTLSSQ